MPALNFKKEFAENVSSKIKHQTVRAKRKRPIAVGDTLYLYTGMRTKNCRILGIYPCASVKEIIIRDHGMVILDGKPLSGKDLKQFVRDDGFNSVSDFLDEIFTTYGSPFVGDVYTW